MIVLRRFVLPVLALICLHIAVANAGQRPIIVDSLNATIDAVNLPITGNPSTGTITAIFSQASIPQDAYIDSGLYGGHLVWPTRLDFPLLHTLGHPPIDMALVGPFTGDPSDNKVIACADIGYVNDPQLGQIYAININTNVKTKDVGTLWLPGKRISGSFGDADAAFFDRVEKNWLRQALDTALTRLRTLYPSVPTLPSNVLDSVYQTYKANPAAEIILYFPDAGVYRTSNLHGGDGITSKSVPTLSEWGMIIFSLLILSLVTSAVLRRKTVAAGVGSNLQVTVGGPLFVGAIYFKTLLVTMSLAAVGLAISAGVYGTLAMRDIIGTFLSAAIVAYMAHVIIIRRKEG